MEHIKTIALFGATGKTGKAIIQRASNQNIKVDEVNIRNISEEELAKKISRVDGVVIVFGPRPPYKDIFCAKETGRIIALIKQANIKRLICQTGAMIGEYPENRSLFFNIFSDIFRKNNPEGYEDREKQEKLIKHSHLDWTIIKPPKLTEGSEHQVYAGTGVKVGLLSSLSRASLADFIIREILSPSHIRQSVFVKN